MTSATVAMVLRFADYGCNAAEIAEYLRIEERDVSRLLALRVQRAA